MPLYEYLCDKCGTKFEVIEKFSAEPLTVHAGECGGPVHRLLSAPALQFKGSGFYITDYAKSGSSSKGGESKKNGGEGKSSESNSSESSSKSSESSSSSSTPATTTSSSSSSSSDSGGSKS
jgi:putative FmdB family regulatory protein